MSFDTKSVFYDCKMSGLYLVSNQVESNQIMFILSFHVIFLSCPGIWLNCFKMFYIFLFLSELNFLDYTVISYMTLYNFDNGKITK